MPYDGGYSGAFIGNINGIRAIVASQDEPTGVGVSTNGEVNQSSARSIKKGTLLGLEFHMSTSSAFSSTQGNPGTTS